MAFRRNTLFVIGAGASKEVGLPTGAELAESIADKLDLRFEFSRLRSGDPTIAELLHKHARNNNANSNEYYAAGRQIGRGIRYSRSIDEYINKHRDNRLMQLCAKLAIVRSIMEAERRSHLFVNENKVNSDSARVEEVNKSWMLEFCRTLLDGRTIEEVNNLFDGISFIIFNYDRCVEQFLFHAIQRCYGLRVDAASEALRSLKIIHPYGSLGPLPWQDREFGVAFGGGIHDEADILSLSSRIRTLYEQEQEQSDFRAIQTIVEAAEIIVCLGFGYHPQNLEMLKPAGETALRRIYGTAYGESEAGVEAIRERLLAVVGNNVIRSTHHVKVHNEMRCADLVREYTRVLSAG
jgi:hypothetical protein